jgi:hypothetical protein
MDNSTALSANNLRLSGALEKTRTVILAREIPSNSVGWPGLGFSFIWCWSFMINK